MDAILRNEDIIVSFRLVVLIEGVGSYVDFRVCQCCMSLLLIFRHVASRNLQIVNIARHYLFKPLSHITKTHAAPSNLKYACVVMLILRVHTHYNSLLV